MSECRPQAQSFSRITVRGDLCARALTADLMLSPSGFTDLSRPPRTCGCVIMTSARARGRLCAWPIRAAEEAGGRRRRARGESNFSSPTHSSATFHGRGRVCVRACVTQMRSHVCAHIMHAQKKRRSIILSQIGASSSSSAPFRSIAHSLFPSRNTNDRIGAI